MGRKRDDRKRGRRQGIFWMLTIPQASFTPWLPPNCQWIVGQLELGAGGFLHWQCVVAFTSKCGRSTARETFGPFHCELTLSAKANDYVGKDATCIEGTRFELGAKPICIASKVDWEEVWDHAVTGSFQSIPAGIRVRSYHSLCSIRSHHQRPVSVDRKIWVFWGVTGSGKSFRAWEEAGHEAYSKDPRSKFWCGYSGQSHVVIDEFRGGIDLSHLLRWFDRYPICVEIKGSLVQQLKLGSSIALVASTIWITSNLDPRSWYPDLDSMSLDALFRKIEVVYFDTPYLP